MPVFLDSPLGLEITKVYSALSEYWDREARENLRWGDHPIDFDGLYAVRRHSDHLKLCRENGPMVILAGSGMCTGGRILNHIREGIGEPKNDMLFVGYQVRGTPGRDILTYARKPGGYVMVNGDRLEIKAKIHQLSGYSAHADRKGLVEWVGAMDERPERIKLVHGGRTARATLGRVLGGGAE